VDIKAYFKHAVHEQGGYKVLHAHFDKSNLVTPDILMQAQKESMQDKWHTYNKLKANYTFDDIYQRSEKSLHSLIKQNVSLVRTFADADMYIGQMCIDALLKLKEDYSDVINIEIATQPIEGVLKKDNYQAFLSASSKADLIGGLPSRDPSPQEHLHCLIDIAEKFDLPLDVHCDQLNSPQERETELLLNIKRKRKFKNKTNAIHSISLSAHPEHYQKLIAKRLASEDVGVIICPSAALSMKPLHYLAPIHNSIAPLKLLLDAGVNVGLGIDNIADLYMPLVDGDMWFECRLLMEATRYYNIQQVANIATTYL